MVTMTVIIRIIEPFWLGKTHKIIELSYYLTTSYGAKPCPSATCLENTSFPERDMNKYRTPAYYTAQGAGTVFRRSSSAVPWMSPKSFKPLVSYI